MAAVKMMQGDSYAIPIDLKLEGVMLTPDTVEEVEVCVGSSLRKTYTGGTVGFDLQNQEWFIRPTQEETLGMDAIQHEVMARVKLKNGAFPDVIGVRVGQIQIIDSISEEVI